MKLRSILAVGLVLMGTTSVRPATVVLNEVSSPPGFVNQTRDVESATQVSTLVPPVETSGYRFTHWDLKGVRQQDATGRAVNQSTFTIYENTTATAHYLPTGTDADADGIPDWFEIEFFGTLTNGPASDTDGDGLTLIKEYERDLHPGVRNGTRDGGISRGSSLAVSMVLSPDSWHYVESSDPVGLLEQDLIVTNGTAVVSTAVATEIGTLSFGYLTVNGVRQTDATGRALVQVTVSVTGDTAVVAHYFPSGTDSDTDGILDWYEWQFFGSLGNGAVSDTDGDGLTLREEYDRDLHPGIFNGIRDGGLSRGSSMPTIFSLDGFHRYTIKSDPPGLVAEISDVAEYGTVISTPNLHGDYSGYTFTGWAMNGVRQTDSAGTSISQVTFTLSTNTTLVANLVPSAQDSDADGILDWFELWLYGGLAQDAASDTDGDGLPLDEEYERDTNPLIANNVRDGGISRATGGLASLNLQPFERPEYLSVAGALAKAFSPFPDVLTGWDYGDSTAPVLGDWDGDLDLDLFVLHENGLSVYENIRNRFVFDVEDRSANFAGLAGCIAGLTRPVGALGDVDGDGKGDLVVGGAMGVLQFFLSTGHFGLSQPGTPSFTLDTGSSSAIPALGDFNRDGQIDLLVLLADGTVDLYSNTGSPAAPYSPATRTAGFISASITGGTSMTAADIDGDSLVDVLVADAEGRIWEFHATDTGSPTLKSKVWARGGAGFATGLTITAGDINGDGDVDALAGLANGGIMELRDPRVGRPTGLTATPGADSIRLNWDADRQWRIKGYYAYRTLDIDLPGPWDRLTSDMIPIPEFVDSGLPLSTAYYYYVTALTTALYPGNSQPNIVESDPSEIVSTMAGRATLRAKAVRAKPGHFVKTRISIDNSTGISGEGMEIHILYDAIRMTPRSQVDPSKPTVHLTGLSKNLIFSDNSATSNGELVITGQGGALEPGDGKLFTIEFLIAESIPRKTILTFAIDSAFLRDLYGNPLVVDIVNEGGIEIEDGYLPGDLDGDGLVGMADFARLRDLLKPSSDPPTPEELLAGDLNGDGRLTHKDLVLLLRLILGLPLDEN